MKTLVFFYWNEIFILGIGTTIAFFTKIKSDSIDISSFDTSNVTDTYDMFREAEINVAYAKTQADADKFNSSRSKPTTFTFVVKSS